MGLRTNVLAAFAVLFVFAIEQLEARPKTDTPPHILFIVADDLGWNDVSWRDPKMHSPNIDRLAREGVILNNSYVQPLCSPSRSSFLSGNFPFRMGLQHLTIEPRQAVGLQANLTLLPNALKQRGYATHAIGKWHLGFCNWKYTPTFRGFDSFLGYYNSGEDYYTHNRAGYLDFSKNRQPDREDDGVYSTYLYTDRAVEILQTHNKSQPLFIYLPFQSVHEPLQVPDIYVDRYCSHTKNESRRTKCGMVAVLDEAIGNITRELDIAGYMDNLLIIFTTDNGGPVWFAGNNWPLRGSKGTVYEGGTRGTAFIYSKTLLPNLSGTTHNGMIHAVDWYPTIMSIVGGDTPSGIDGVSQWDSLLHSSPSPRSEFVYNMDNMLKSGAIRSGDWKLVQGNPDELYAFNGWYPPPGEEDTAVPHSDQAPVGPDDYQLFNIKEDPLEFNDVKDKYPDVLAKMKARLGEWQKLQVPANFPADDPDSDPTKYGDAWSPGWC